MFVLYHDQEVRRFLHLKTVDGRYCFLAWQIVEQVRGLFFHAVLEF